MGLKIDINRLNYAVINAIKEEFEIACEHWKVDAESKRNRSTKFGESSTYSYEVKKAGENIIAILKANPSALADSYGTGSLMLEDNPVLGEYIRNRGSEQGQYNPARTGKTIQGRPAGTYKDIFGTWHTSKGTMAGKNIEGLVVHGRQGQGEWQIRPSAPSYALQEAEEWLIKSWFPAAYSRIINKIDFSKYLIES